MESDEDVIRIKVRNTLALKNINPAVLDWVKERQKTQSPFKGHYETPTELINDLKMIEEPKSRKSLLEWLKNKNTENPVIAQAVAYFERTDQ